MPNAPIRTTLSRRGFGALALASGFTSAGAWAQGARPLTIGVLNDSSATTIFRAQSVQGSLTGTIAELRAVIALAQQGKLAPIPVRTMPKDQANAAIDELEHGRVTGRIVLVENHP